MLLCLMFHRVGEGKHANPLPMLDAHFAHIAKRYPILLPGEPVKRGCNLCLTFDDATFDFYRYVYPLLKKYNLRALLAVPTMYILEESNLPPEARLAVPYPLAMQEGIFDTKAPLCTWQEIREMVKSGHVEVASHSHMHCNLTFPFVDFEREVIHSKEILEEKLDREITSFVYPFGRTNKEVQRKVSEHYRYTFRIGSAANKDWSETYAITRIIADQMATAHSAFSLQSKVAYLLNHGLDRLTHRLSFG